VINDGSELLDITAMCRLLNIARRTFFAMKKAGRILPPSTPWTRRLARWSRNEVELWLLHGAPSAARWAEMKAQRAARGG
jgi:predicted DNA-binding transcriptional regulator AlpA